MRGDADAVAGFAHAAFKHVAHAEFAPDLLHIDRVPLVGKGAVARDDEEPSDLGQRGDDLLHRAVGEILLLWVAADVLERQHRDRGLVGQWQSGDGKGYRWSGMQPINPDRLRDILGNPGTNGTNCRPSQRANDSARTRNRIRIEANDDTGTDKR